MISRRIKIFFIFEKCINNSQKFMSGGQNRFFIRQSLSFSPLKIAPEYRIVSDYIYTHKPYNPSQMPISSFRNLALSFKVSRFINSRIKSCIGNQLFVRLKSLYILNFSKKMKRCNFSNSLNRKEDIKVLASGNLFTSGFKKFFNFFKGFLKEEEFLNGSGKNIFFCGPILSYRIFSKGFYFFSRNGGFFTFLRGEYIFNFLKRGFFNSFSRGEFFKKFKNGGIVDIDGSFKFREGNDHKFFEVIFSFSDFLRNSFSFSGKVFKFFRSKGLGR